MSRNVITPVSTMPEPRVPLKSCLCKHKENLEEEIKDKDGVSLLSSKASVEVIERPKVEDVQIAIFLERIQSLFGRVMNNLELAAALRLLLKDPELPKILTTREMKRIRAALIEHVATSEISSLKSHKSAESSADSSKESESNVPSTINLQQGSSIRSNNIYQALQILNSYPVIHEKVKSSCKNIALQSHLFIEHVKFFIEHCVRRIALTPEQENIRQAHFRKIWRENHRAQQDIAALLRDLEIQRSRHLHLMKIIGEQCEKDSAQLERINRTSAEDIKVTINRSEREQIAEHKTSEMRQKDLREYLDTSQKKYDNLKEANNRINGEIRLKRFKISTQLSNLIRKFDNDVGKRQEILNGLIEEYERDKMAKEQLENMMREQFKIYNAFVEERENARLTLFREKYNKFMTTRAAKIIQRWWRLKFVSKKKKKSPKKKAKKKKSKV